MKKLVYLFVLAGVFALISGCASLKKMKENAEEIDYTVEPDVPEMHVGEVAVSVSGKFPEKYFHKKATALITPVWVYEGGETPLSSVTVQGEKVEGNNTAIKYTEGGNFSYSDKVAYKKEMMRSRLEVRITASKGEDSVEFPPYTLAQGIVATPDLVQVTPKVVAAKDKFQRNVPASELADIYFDKNKSKLKYSEKRSEEIENLKDYIASVKEDERKRLEKMEVHGYASPEGSQELNEELSGNRAEVAKEFIDDEFKDIEELNETEFFIKNATKEDWEGFKKLVKESSLEEKDMILRVLEMHSDVDQREKEFRNMTKVFNELEEEIHPKLRRSEMKLNIMLIGHSDDEIKQLVNEDIDSLKKEELMYAGTLFDDNNKKLTIYQEFVSQYPDDWRGHNNVGVVQFELENYEAAATAFEKAKNANANATVHNNMGAVELINDNLDKAQENFTSATGVGDAVSYNMGIVKIKQADYEQAVSYFGDNCCFNAALANVLNGNLDEAVRLAECGDDKDEAMNYYIKAVAGVRKSDTELMYNNLRTACTKDASLKQHAAKDVEFIDYFEQQTFKNIVE
ncbi:MAG: OmpA family protein [Bacteroidota bacterium]|nr:OmpA family protein [Bacteroidota bacterium]